LIQFLLDFQGIANQLPDNIMAAERWCNRIVRRPNAFPDPIDGLTLQPPAERKKNFPPFTTTAAALTGHTKPVSKKH
jgi:hypothetical protein|tara:strand:+ start:845 stop:1075 length:231 start_codon:yes stop_codon:yes gene_type:complete